MTTSAYGRVRRPKLIIAASTILIVSVILIWIARSSFYACAFGLGGGTPCPPDPKLLPAIVWTVIVICVFGVIVLTLTVRRFAGHEKLTTALFVALAIAAAVGPVWTYVTFAF